MSFSIQRSVLKYDKQMATFLENLETTSLTFQRSVGGWSKLTLVYLVSSRGKGYTYRIDVLCKTYPFNEVV